MSKEELPSIDDEIISDLPSVEDFITEENAEELPSVEEYIEKEEVVETVEEEVEQATDLTEIVRLINDVRKDIPDIPEVKYVNSFKNNIYCDPKGQHKIIGKCPNSDNKINIIATNKLSNEGEELNYFSVDSHQKLMNNLEKPSKDIIGFELKI